MSYPILFGNMAGQGGLDGLSASSAAPSAEFLRSNGATTDGVYWISASWTSNIPTEVYCDMTTDGGGWMLYGTKVSAEFHPFQTINSSSNRYKVTNSDNSGRVPSSNFNSLMWRFLDKSGKPYVTKYTKSEDAGSAKTLWNNWVVNPDNNNSAQQVGGWRRSTNAGQTFSSIYLMPELFFYTTGLSEQHGNPPGSDQYLDLWNAIDGTNNYNFTDNSEANGRKCIAGYCYISEPILYMWK